MRSASKSPGYRAWLLCRNTWGKDPLIDSILAGDIDSESLAEVKALYDDGFTRLYVEACLLATEDFDAISETLEIDKDLLELYHDVYYTIHDYSRIHKVQHLSKIKDNDERNLKQWALTSGIDFIKWRIGCLTKSKSPIESMEDLHRDAFYKAKEAFFNSSSTTASKEGLLWSKQALNIARLMTAVDTGVDEDAADDINIELARLTEDNAQIPGIEDLK